MKRRKENRSLPAEIEQALAPGRFVSYSQSRDFIHDLENVKNQVDALANAGEAESSVPLYEMFLAGCYEKAEESDDSGGNLGMFFEELFVSWIGARQKAGYAPEETVSQILKWMGNDKYGFCSGIERSVADALDRRGYACFKSHFENQFEDAFKPFRAEPPRPLGDYPIEVSRSADIMRNTYVGRKDVRSYLALCEKIGPSPKDCESIAELLKRKRRPEDALSWIERGLALETRRPWGNQSSYSLRRMREELLGKLGRTPEAFESAWADFQECPSAYRYASVMKYATRDNARYWHAKALEVAGAASLPAFIEICVETKEWDVLAERAASAARTELEGISHYVTEKAAKGLARKHVLVAAKVYCALGMRILKSGKSKYYPHALGHFREAKRLAGKSSRKDLWQDLVDEIKKNHSRKCGFAAEFEKLVAGIRIAPAESFEERSRKRWKKQALE